MLTYAPPRLVAKEALRRQKGVERRQRLVLAADATEADCVAAEVSSRDTKSASVSHRRRSSSRKKQLHHHHHHHHEPQQQPQQQQQQQISNLVATSGPAQGVWGGRGSVANTPKQPECFRKRADGASWRGGMAGMGAGPAGGRAVHGGGGRRPGEVHPAARGGHPPGRLEGEWAKLAAACCAKSSRVVTRSNRAWGHMTVRVCEHTDRVGRHVSVMCVGPQDKHGFTAPHYAAAYGDLKLVQLLVDSGADAKAKATMAAMCQWLPRAWVK